MPVREWIGDFIGYSIGLALFLWFMWKMFELVS